MLPLGISSSWLPTYQGFGKLTPRPPRPPLLLHLLDDPPLLRLHLLGAPALFVPLNQPRIQLEETPSPGELGQDDVAPFWVVGKVEACGEGFGAVEPVGFAVVDWVGGDEVGDWGEQ